MKLKEGDVFSVQLDSDKIVAGQIILRNRHQLYIVFFESLYNSTDQIEKENVAQDEIVVVARTLDLFFKLKRWKVLFNCATTADAAIFPNYKIETLEGTFIMNFDRQIIRKASKDEEKFYFFYNDYSPAYVMSALKAYYGIIAMDDDYRKLTYGFVRQRSNINN